MVSVPVPRSPQWSQSRGFGSKGGPTNALQSKKPMERGSTTPTRRVSPSDPASSRKRTSSPGAFTPSAKKPKAEPSRCNSDKDKKRKRRKKKQPITRDVEMSLGLAQKDCSTSHSPQSLLPTASSSTQMDTVGSSSPVSDDLPPISLPDPSPHVASSSPVHHDTDRPECRDALQQESAMQVVHSESKVCLSSLFLFSGAQTVYSPCTTIKHFLPPSSLLWSARSALIYFTDLLPSPRVVTFLVIVVLLIGSMPTDNPMNSQATTFSARKHAPSAVPWCVDAL